MTITPTGITALTLLTLSTAIPALAAGPTACSASVPAAPTIRAEGKAELVGDVVVTCIGGTPTAVGSLVPQLNLTIFLTAPIASRTFNNSSSAETLLLLEEPGSKNNPNQLLCPSTSGCALTGSGSGGVKYDGFAGHPNIFQGFISGNTVTFFGVPLDAPAVNGSRALRVVNLRVDASAGAAQITASVAIPSLTVTNGSVVVAAVASGLSFSLRSGSDLTKALAPAGFSIPTGTLGRSDTPVAYLRFAPSFSRAFRTRTSAAFAGLDISPPPAAQAVPGAALTNESEFTFPVPGGTAGLADAGTRLKAALNNIPKGVRVWVGLTNSGASSTATVRLMSSETAPFVPVPASDTFGSTMAAEIPIVNGSGTAVWEVLATGSTTTFNVPVWLTADAAVAGVGIVNGTLAPLFAFAPANVPRFTDPSTALNLVQVASGSSVTLLANPASLEFRIAPGTSPLQLQTVTLSSTNGATFTAAVSASTNDGSPWLRLPSNCNSTFGCTIFVDATGLPPGFYSGAVRIQMSGGPAGPLSLPVALIVQQPPPTGGSNQIFSHIADGGNWKTSVILVNTDTVPAVFTLRFWNESGGPWTVPLGADGFQTQVSGVIPVGGMRTIQSDGIASNLAVGSAELVTANSIGGTAVFAEVERGLPDSEAAVPGTSLQTKRFLLPFDSSAGTGTGVAIANPDPTQAALVSVIYRDSSGRQTTSSGPYNVPPRGHISFVLPAAAGVEGVAEFSSTVNVVGLGIRGHGRAFTSLEPLARVAPGNKTISHLAEGAGWKTTFILVNADAQTARFAFQFRGDDGSAVTLSLGPDGAHSSLSGSIPPGGSRTIRTDGTSARLVNGWAELTTTAAIGGTAIFAQQTPGVPVSEAAVPIISGGARHFVVPFDGSFGFGTGVAFGNPSENANVTVSFRGEAGQLLGAPLSYVVPARGHFSVVLPVSTRGVAEITSPDTSIFSLGIRGHNGAFTSVRPLLLAPALADILTRVNSITAGGDAGALAPLTADWTTIASGDADTPAPSSFVAVRSYGLGRVAVAGDEGILTNSQLLDNALFATNLMAWLDPAGRRAVVWSGGHGELTTSPGGMLSPALSGRDFTSARVRGAITAASLAGASVLVIGNAQNDFSAAEMQAVTDFVATGGGVLLTGDCGSWLSNHGGKTIADYPMNKMAQPFGLVLPALTIVDPDPQDQVSGATIFRTFYPNGRP